MVLSGEARLPLACRAGPGPRDKDSLAEDRLSVAITWSQQPHILYMICNHDDGRVCPSSKPFVSVGPGGERYGRPRPPTAKGPIPLHDYYVYEYDTSWSTQKKEKRGDTASAKPLRRRCDLPATLPVSLAPAFSVLFPKRRPDRPADLQVPFPSRLPRQQDASTPLRSYDVGRPLLSGDKPAVYILLIKKG
jgi:hypothetical protein